MVKIINTLYHLVDVLIVQHFVFVGIALVAILLVGSTMGVDGYETQTIPVVKFNEFLEGWTEDNNNTGLILEVFVPSLAFPMIYLGLNIGYVMGYFLGPNFSYAVLDKLSVVPVVLAGSYIVYLVYRLFGVTK
jgi:hypothetical protein